MVNSCPWRKANVSGVKSHTCLAHFDKLAAEVEFAIAWLSS